VSCAVAGGSFWRPQGCLRIEEETKSGKILTTLKAHSGVTKSDEPIWASVYKEERFLMAPAQ
jgi:hypothetical protein